MTTRRPVGKRRRIGLFLLADVLAMSFLLSTFATTENCAGIASVTTSITYDSAPFQDRIVKTVLNVSGSTKASDQKIGLRLPNAVVLTSAVARKNGGTVIPLIECPPALRELEENYPSGLNDRWLALQMPVVSLNAGEFMQLEYILDNILADGTAIERATRLDAEFSCAQSYVNSYPLRNPGGSGGPGGPGGGGGGGIEHAGPSLSDVGRVALLLALVGAGVLFLSRRPSLA